MGFKKLESKSEGFYIKNISIVILILLLSGLVGAAYGEIDYQYAEQTEDYEFVKENWDYQKQIDFEDQWSGDMTWGEAHDVFIFKVDTTDLVEREKVRDDCRDMRVAVDGKLAGTRVQESSCGSEETWVYFSNSKTEFDYRFDTDKEVENVELFYGNKIASIGNYRVSPTNRNLATLVRPESAIEMFYGTHGDVSTSTDTRIVTNDQDEPEQVWQAEFTNDHGTEDESDCIGGGLEAACTHYVYIQDGSGNEEQVSVIDRSGDTDPNPNYDTGDNTYTLHTGNAPSWLEEGDDVWVYFEGGSSHSGYTDSSLEGPEQFGYPIEIDITNPSHGDDLQQDEVDLDTQVRYDNSASVEFNIDGDTFTESTTGSSPDTVSINNYDVDRGQSYTLNVEACEGGNCDTDSITFDVSGGPEEPEQDGPGSDEEGEVISDPDDDHVELSAQYTHEEQESGEMEIYFKHEDDSDFDRVRHCQNLEHEDWCSTQVQVESGEEYEWYTVSISGDQEEQGEVNSFQVNTPPEPPTLISPNSGIDGEDPENFEIEALVEDPDGDDMTVTLHMDSDSDSTSFTQTNVDDGSQIEMTANGLERGETYDWYVEACDIHGACETSDETREVTTLFEPSFSNEDPGDGSFVLDTEIDVSVTLDSQDDEPFSYEIIRVDNNEQIASGTSPGPEITQEADYGSVVLGEQYEWRVSAHLNDYEHVTDDITYDFEVLASPSFRVETQFDYEYSSVVKNEEENYLVNFEVFNPSNSNKDVELEISGLDAEFQESEDQTILIEDLEPGEEESEFIVITESDIGSYILTVETTDEQLGTSHEDELAVEVREQVETSMTEVSGIGLLNILVLISSAIILFYRIK